MPFLIVIAVVVIALLVGAYRGFTLLHAALGLPAAVGIAVVVVLLILAVAWFWQRRHRAIYGVRDPRKPTHVLERPWGSITIWRVKRELTLRLGTASAEAVFGDIQQARIEPGGTGGASSVVLTLAHATPADWRLPMDSPAEARRWKKIFELARDQKL